jgi:uncharacterized membrane protein (UPF0127 family)
MKARASLLLALALCGCPKPAAEPPRAVEVDAGRSLPRTHLDLESADGRSFGIEAELALTDADRERGLMLRRALSDTEGMLFIFSEPAPRTFWMKNTLIPLDMLFIDVNSRVLGVVERAEPLTLIGRSVPGDALYVLELPGGWCTERHIGAGAVLHFAEASQYPAR